MNLKFLNEFNYLCFYTFKNVSLESDIYKQMSLAALVVGFSYSRWNANVGPDKFVIRFVDESYIQLAAGKVSCKVNRQFFPHVFLFSFLNLNSES